MPGKRSNAIAPDKGTALFSVLGYIVMTAMALICLLPFWLMVTGSFSDEHEILRSGFSVLPRGFSLEAYRSIFRGSSKILRAYRTTIGITSAGTLVSLTLTSMAGYVLQRQDFRCRNALSFFVYFTTLFSGGLIPWKAAGLIFYLVIIIYLWAGGIRALALTDVFYGLLIFFTMLTTGFILIEKTGGIEKTFASIAQNNADELILGPGFSNNSPWAWLCMFIVVPLGAFMGPPMWIRAHAAKEEKIFKILPLLLVMATIMYLGPLLTAAAAKVLYPGLEQTDNLIPYLLVNNVPIIASTVLLCGIVAAALSTANSQIHALAALYTVDIHKRYIREETTERQLVSISKWAILILSALAYVLMLKNPGMIIDTGILGMGGTAQIIVPALGALFWEKSNGSAMTAGLLAGIALLCFLCFVCHTFTPYAAVISLAVNASVFLVLSALLPSDQRTRENIASHKESFSRRNHLMKGW
jgi:SSS family solute:Na+ symporter